jgi:hypothetical protein
MCYTNDIKEFEQRILNTFKLKPCSVNITETVLASNVAEATKTEPVCAPAVNTALYNSITSNDRVFVLRNNAVFEYNHTTGKLVDSDYTLTAPDYTAMVRQKINEICIGIKYETCAKHPFKTESFVFSTIVKANVIDMLKCDVDISALEVKPIIEFLINVKADIIELLKKSVGMEGAHPDLDISTVCIVAINMMLTDGGSDAEAIIRLKKILLLTDMIMQQVEVMKTAAKHKNNTEINSDEKKEPDKKED